MTSKPRKEPDRNVEAHIYMTPALKRDLEDAARKACRSVNGQILYFIVRGLEREPPVLRRAQELKNVETLIKAHCASNPASPTYGDGIEAAAKALHRAYNAVQLLDDGTLGYGNDDYNRWPLRDELMAEIDKALIGLCALAPKAGTEQKENDQ